MDEHVGGPDTEPEPISLGEVEVGDLVFLMPPDPPRIPENPPSKLAAMIVKYDGGPFSHVGIVVDAGVMVSSRTSRSLEPLTDRDTGGVRLNALEDLRERRPHIARPKFDLRERIAAATHTLELLEYGAAHRSAFSFIKLFIVAAGLDAVRPEKAPVARNAILAAASRAAKLWQFSEQRRMGQQPSFFCSEVIPFAYSSASFTYADFEQVPQGNPAAAEALSFGDVDWYFKRLKKILDGPSDLTPEQVDSVKSLGMALLVHDRPFLKEAGAALFDQLRPRNETTGEAPPATARVPSALVTPRMLHRAPWIEWTRPLALPTRPPV